MSSLKLISYSSIMPLRRRVGSDGLLQKILPYTTWNVPNENDGADPWSFVYLNFPRHFPKPTFPWTKLQRAQVNINTLLSKNLPRNAHQVKARGPAQDEAHTPVQDKEWSPESRFLWNMLQPINSLPPDILSWIVQHAANDSEVGTELIVHLTHVCQHWRECIARAPGHWTRIADENKDLVALGLDRSKAAPLKVLLNMENNHDWFSDLIKPHLQRTAFLQISQLTTFGDLAEIFPDFPQLLPHLHSLEICRSKNYVPPPDDPFKPFTFHLRSLSLFGISLYQSILNIRTLTKFILKDIASTYSLDTLLVFLEENGSLKHVELLINLSSSRSQVPIKNQIQFLSVESPGEENIKALVSHIPLQRGGDLKITSHSSSSGLGDIFPYLQTVHSVNLLSPTSMCFYSRDCIKISGPDGSLRYHGPSISVRSLIGLPPPTFENIQDLHLKLRGPIDPTLPHFPALETLAIDFYHSDFETLFSLLPPPELSPLLKTLTFWYLEFPKQFMEKLIQFASNHKNVTFVGLYCVVLICCHEGESPEKPPSFDFVSMLQNYVFDVKVQHAGKL